MNQADYRTIKIERRGRILYLIMNRPATLNAVDVLMHTELARVFRDANDDTESDIVVLTGAGRAFCAGGDVDWMQDAIDHPENFESTVAEAKQIVFSLLDCEKPVIAKVNGAAVGLGATLALFCDIGIAAETAIFADPHVSIGMVAGDGGAVIWPQLIGFARAKEFLFRRQDQCSTCQRNWADQSRGAGRQTGRRSRRFRGPAGRWRNQSDPLDQGHRQYRPETACSQHDGHWPGL